ncbi:MAG TPA: helix-hairpin-helix domain-containing protein, partial [Candidatus Saccharimonadales bacterium]|nr:helix-hairpin-helix domain-containing protein [Candidatus Saccharimonadales bacterium]
ETNVKKWGLPDLFLIDGGKGQLSAAMAARDEAGHHNIPMIGLAKRFEEIVIKDASGNFQVHVLGLNSPSVKLLQRIRDESHRFAVSYHSLLARRRQTASLLDGVPGVGPATRKKLIKHFGSTRGVLAASEVELAKVLGPKKAKNLYAQLSAIR